MNMDISIYVMAHKAFEKPDLEGYVPLQVGAALKQDLGYVRDDTGESISEKNPNYCELTGLYWMWKNSKADIIGLCHYRRYLSSFPMDRKFRHLLTVQDIRRRLAKNDIILPIPDINGKTNRQLYCEGHYEKDLELTRQIIAQQCSEYLGAFDTVMNSKCCCMCNMFIAKKTVIDGYCQWLFEIFEELEKRVDLQDYSVYQARIYGFLSERLFNVWIYHNKLKKNYAFLANQDNDYKQIILTKLKGIRGE